MRCRRFRARASYSQRHLRRPAKACCELKPDATPLEPGLAAHVVIMACNGIGTPRLLLNSRSRHFPDGLANRSGLVGRNLMFHPYAIITGIFDEPLEGYKGPTGCSLMSHEFYETDGARGFARGYSFEMLRGFGPVATALYGMTFGRVLPGAGHHHGYAELADRTAGIAAICEDLPEPGNRVTLDPDLADSTGIPAPKVTYRLSENSVRTLDHAVARGRELMAAAGARDTMVQAPLTMAGWHLMGTARMGRDPATSVVNEWGRCHDVRNLHRGRQHLRHRRRREPDQHHPGAGAVHRRRDQAAPEQSVRRLKRCDPRSRLP